MMLFIIRYQILLILKENLLKREPTLREQIGREQMRKRTNVNIPFNQHIFVYVDYKFR